MLEPWTPAALAPSRFRALAVRHGIDLEPQLPDPAPAYVDPAGAMHPALMEPMGSLLLHSWPTPGARAALVSRLLSEPGRPDPSDSQDPFVRLARFADQQRMEPEVRGSLTLLLVRGWLSQEQRSWRPVLPDPVAALRDPDVDAYKHRRARLDDTPWRDLLATIQRCAEQAGDHEALAFERVLVAAGAQWLALYGRWWDAAGLLGPDEAMPADPGPLRVALRGVRAALAAILGMDPSAPIEALLRASLDAGCAAEAAFVDAVVARPDGAITAKWLLEQQIRSMRNLMTATRPHSLDLHGLLRRSDVLRLATHIGWRVALLELWLTDVTGVIAVASRAFVKAFGGAERVLRLVSVGGPHAGTAMYRLAPPGLRDVLAPDSHWVRRLAEGPEPVPTVVVRARYDHQVLPPVRARLDGVREVVIDRHGHNGLLWHRTAHAAIIDAIEGR